MSFAPAFANGRCISMRDAGAVPQRSKFRQSIRPIVPDIAGIQKTDLTTIFLQQRYYASPLIVQNMGASAINTAMFFQS